MPIQVFIDGEAGTTGLQIRGRLTGRSDIQLIQLDDAHRKDETARADALNDADLAILCLPDDAAKLAVSLIRNDRTRVIDASTAHRTAPGWTYGFPELSPTQRQAVREARWVSNPGCYPTGFLSLVRPLVAGGLIPADWPVTVNAVSGYTGGGKAMITEFEDETSPTYTRAAYRIYATGLGHKHIAEMQVHSGLTHAPVFTPAVGRFAQGMIVEVPLQLNALPAKPSLEAVREALQRTYAGERFVDVVDAATIEATKTLDPEGLNGTNRLKLFAFGDAVRGQARLVALLDNLGKGASGAAVQSLNLMFGLDEATGV